MRHSITLLFGISTLLFAGTFLRASSLDPVAETASAESFTAKVDKFWDWFKTNEKRIHREMFSDNAVENGQEISAQIEAALGKVGWVFGPGETEGNHSLTLTAEGAPHQRLLVQAWKERAPQLEGWDFYASRQPGKMRGSGIEMAELTFGFDDTRVAVTFNKERDLADVVIHHPALATASEQVASQLAFILLDEALGEDRTELWVGGVDWASEPAPEGALDLFQLSDHLLAMATQHEWPLEWGFELYSAYEIDGEKLNASCPRRDVIAGTTCHFPIISEFYRKDGKPRNPIKNSGAHFAYIEIPIEHLAQGLSRHELEDLIANFTDDLRVLGGATGHKNYYVDLLLLDSDSCIEALTQGLADQVDLKSAQLKTFVHKGPDPVLLKAFKP